MLGVSLLKVIFAFKDTFHANGTTFFFFFSEERNTYLFSICLYQRRSLFSFFIHIYIYVVYIYQFTFFYTFLGQAPYTHRVQRHATLALLLHSTVGWLAGIMSSRQCCIWWVSAPTLNTHTHTGIFSLTLWVFCVTPIQPYIMCNLAPASPGSATLPRWHQIRGRGSTADATSFKWSSKSSAARLLWHMQRGARNGWKLEQDRSKVSGGFKWRVHGLAQGCRQIHEWEVGGEGKQGKKGQC